MKDKSQIQADWWIKSFTGAVLGLSLSIALGNLIVVLGQPFIAMDVLAQIGMWSIAWLWMSILFASFFIKTGKLAFIIFLFANFIAYFLLFWLRESI
ncbi:hypothetical protein [Acinetobacter guerrae]|uniref:hypothetical protein n=1 Tax=Acinetobacter guerrae TaxID=1843371 RepID=UPI00125FA29D|nr:hypothetical protein [Acinetobacter guerrae]MPW44229.1 hypothetical protein [Acinetobacter guerrae]